MILEVDKKTIVNKLELHIKKSISLAEEHKSKFSFFSDQKMSLPTKSNADFLLYILISVQTDG